MTRPAASWKTKGRLSGPPPFSVVVLPNSSLAVSSTPDFDQVNVCDRPNASVLPNQPAGVVVLVTRVTPGSILGAQNKTTVVAVFAGSDAGCVRLHGPAWPIVGVFDALDSTLQICRGQTPMFVVLEVLRRATRFGNRDEGVFALGPVTETVGIGCGAVRPNDRQQMRVSSVVMERQDAAGGVGQARDQAGRVVIDRQRCAAGVRQADQPIGGVARGDPVAVDIFPEVQFAIRVESSDQPVPLFQLIGLVCQLP